jgi:hypothetical protein
MSSHKRFVMVTLLTSAAAVTAALGASAAQAAPRLPGVEPVTSAFAAGEFCAFPVAITLVDGQREHTNPGAVLFTGPLAATIENLSSGATITLTASGPTLREGAVSVGPTLIGQPAFRNVGAPFLIFNWGRTTFTENNTIASVTGRTLDLCSALSG